MITKIKVIPCVLRQQESRTQVLTFIHPPPFEHCQLVKGTVERGEDLEHAALRELYEESGIGLSKVRAKIGTIELLHPPGQAQGVPQERQFWKIFHVETVEELPDRWSHIVTGNGVDRRMNFRFYWHDLEDSDDDFHPYFRLVLQQVRKYVRILSVREKTLKQDISA